MKVVLTCEHGGNDIPLPYKPLFLSHQKILESHRGWDIGALEIAEHISQSLKTPLFFSTTSRLLVELNRSQRNPSLFSEFTKKLQKEEQISLLEHYYYPYRTRVTEFLEDQINKNNEVIHISVHTFTAIFNNKIRNCDIGLLYDPRREPETLFCIKWKSEIKRTSPDMKVRFNYPYKGTSDGFTSYLRKLFPQQYIGIELEIKNGLTEKPKKIFSILSSTLDTVLKQYS